MASFGQGINPQLGAINYNSYLQGSLQGSQALGQGIGQLVAGAGQAVKEYYAKQEEKKVLDSVVGGFKEIASKNPRIAQELGISNINDDKAIKVAVKAVGGPAPAMNLLRQYAKQENERNAIRSAMSTAVPPDRALQQYLSSGGSNPEAIMAIQSQQTESALKQAQTKNYLQQVKESEFGMQHPKAPDKVVDPVETAFTDENGQPMIRTIDRITGKEIGRRSLQAPAPQFGQIPAGSVLRQDSKGGYFYETVPGSPQAIAQAKEAEASKKADTSFLDETKGTISAIDDAIQLSSRGAGGEIAGYGPIAAASSMIGGLIGKPSMSETKLLRNKYDTIKSALTIGKLSDLRSASANGASGLGQLTEKEWDGLNSSIAKLDPTLPESMQREALFQVRGYMNKLLINRGLQNQFKVEEVK